MIKGRLLCDKTMVIVTRQSVFCLFVQKKGKSIYVIYLKRKKLFGRNCKYAIINYM